MHCVKDTKGADFSNELRITRSTTVFSKGYEFDKEAYSGFEGTELAMKLEQSQIKCLLVGGVATEYCVKNTVLDALRRGLDVILLEDAVKGIKHGFEDIQEMRKMGTKITNIDNIEV